MKVSVDKQSKVPLYLQLRDSVKYYISTGDIRQNQQLPTVNGLSKELGVNFETVRKAYKELEREGLLSTKRGLGTFVKSPAPSKALLSAPSEPETDSARSAKLAIQQLLRTGTSGEEIKRWVDRMCTQIARDKQDAYVLFAECNTLQARDIARELRAYLEIDARPILIKDLKEHFRKPPSRNSKLLAVVTTGFHLNEVRTIVGNQPVSTEFVITNMSPETRRKIEAFPKSSRFAFICRDPESIGLYRDTLRAELRLGLNLPCFTIRETERISAAVKNFDVLLVTPGAYHRVRKLASGKVPFFNVIDHVDPGSLRIVKERVLGANGKRSSV